VVSMSLIWMGCKPNTLSLTGELEEILFVNVLHLIKEYC